MGDVHALLHKANALQQAGRLTDAAAQYKALLKFLPDHPQILAALGTMALQRGAMEEGLRWLGKSLKVAPDQPVAQANRATALYLLKRFDEALPGFRRAIALKPDYAEAYNNLGAALQELGRLDEALVSFDRAIELRPDYAEAHWNRGKVLKRLGRPGAALESLARAASLRPDHVDAHNHLGAVLQELERYEEAQTAYARAIELNPVFVEAHSNRGVALEALQRFDDALAEYDRAIELKPDYASAYNNRGALKQKRLLLQDALADYDRALALNPDYADAHVNRGGTLQELRRFDEAMAAYDRALTIRPQSPAAHMAKAFTRMLLGDFEEGWKLYEWRWRDRLKAQARDFEQPQWSGDEPIDGKTVLIHPEQGYGDFIQCCRYAPLARALGARVVLETPPALTTLVSTLDEGCIVIEQGRPLPSFDLHCPVMSLPRAFGTTVATVPSGVPYLRPSAEHQALWRQRLGQRTRPRVGLTWSGFAGHKNDCNRSIPLERLLPCLDGGIEFHSLQIEVRPDDQCLLARTGIRDHRGELRDFSDTAALIREMDLVLCVDTSVAHVAGALGMPVWILLPYTPDFRWMLDRDDTPWYPTARLLRQPRPGDWDTVITDVAKRLRARS